MGNRAAAAEQHSKIHADWARAHPDRAREEHAFRLAERQAEDRFGHKVHGTVETHAKAGRVQQGALARLYESGTIDAEQLGSALEIAEAHRVLTGDMQIRTMSLETRVDGGGRGAGAFWEALGAVRREVAYSKWRAALLPRAAALVLAVVADDLALTSAARQAGMHRRTARASLCDALDLWRDLHHQACKQVDAASLAAAQAGILG